MNLVKDFIVTSFVLSTASQPYCLLLFSNIASQKVITYFRYIDCKGNHTLVVTTTTTKTAFKYCCFTATFLNRKLNQPSDLQRQYGKMKDETCFRLGLELNLVQRICNQLH